MQEDVTIRRLDLQPILTGHLDALEQFILRPIETFNQATAAFILEHTALALLADPKNHCALTLDGFIRLIAKPANANKADLPAALRCFEQAANMGNPFALVCAADCYANAKGTEQNLIKAAKYYRRALQILGDHAKTKTDFDQMIKRFECPVEAYYQHHITTKQISKMSLFPNYWEYLCLLYYDQDPALTKELKVQYAKIICPLREDDVFKPSRYSKSPIAENFLVCGMIACWEADACPIEDVDMITTKLKFAVACVEQLEALGEQAVNQLILTDTIELTQARWMLATIDIDDPQNIFDIVEKLISIKTLDESSYLLAELLMRLNTQNIFVNHKDKYRLIIGLLSKVDEATKARHPEFNVLFKNAIASLQSIQTAADFSKPDDTIYLSFKQLINAVPGLRDNSKLLYSPRLEYELTNAEKARQLIVEKFGDYPIVTFEQLIYKSYNDCYEQLNLTYLHERLLKQFQSRVLPKKAAIAEFVIDSGNAGLGRKRLIAFIDINQANTMHLRDLALKAVELAVAEFNITVNSIGFYAVAFKLQYRAAKQLQQQCIDQSDYKEILKLIVTYLTGRGGLDKGWFKFALLQQLTEALNLGNIERLESEPGAFCKELCEILLGQCQHRVELPVSEKTDISGQNSNMK